jgi:Family of unknown function (DUF6205)
MPKKTKAPPRALNPPERIFLVVGLESDAEFSELTDVTWCKDHAFPSDIEYRLVKRPRMKIKIMGYLTRVEGQITITPPLRWSEMKDSQFYGGESKGMDVTIQLKNTWEETDEGYFDRRLGVALVPASEERFKAYSIDEHLKMAVEEFGRQGHKLEGYFEGSGEEDGDLWRLVVKDNQVKRLVPKVVWPDET